MTAKPSKPAPAATFIQVKHRLTRLIREPGGLTQEHALKDARMNLDHLREDCVAAIDDKLSQMERRFGRARKRPGHEALEELYRLSNDIVATAGLFDMEPLGQAAFSLCEVIDRLNAENAWDWPAVELHLSGMRALRHADPGDPGAAAVLDGLRKLVAHLNPHRRP